MKHRIIISALFATLAFCSCNKIPNQSIFSPLSMEDLSKAIKSDPTFSDCYESLQEDITDASDIMKAKYYDITYRDYFEFYKYATDTATMFSLYNQFAEEWRSKYGIYDAKVDSVIKYWSDYIKANSLDKYVDIKCTDFKVTRYQYIDDIEKITLRFDITSDAGLMQGLKFNYSIVAKDGSYRSAKETISLPRAWMRSTTTYCNLDRLTLIHIKDKNITDYFKKYDVLTEVTAIQVYDKKYSIDDLKVPNTVLNLLNNQHIADSYVYDSFVEELVKEQFNKKYESKTSYCDRLYEDNLKKKNSRIWNFYNELYGEED